MRNTSLIAFVIIIIFSCNPQKIDTKSEGDKIMQISRDWSQIASTADVEKILSYWADDAVVMSGGQPTFKGKGEIRKMVEESFKIPGFKISWEPQSVDVSKSGDLAYLIEKETINMNDFSGRIITLHSNVVTVWRKQDNGDWKTVVDAAVPEPTMKN